MARAIPEGFRTLTPHLVAQAIEFYKKAFGAQEVMRMPAPDGSITHAELRIGDSLVMLADENPQMGAIGPKTLKGSPVTLHLYVPDVDQSFGRAVGAGATAVMPPSDMFWGDRYSQVKDPFGHSWSIATHKKDMTPEQIAAAAQQFFTAGGCGGC